MSKKAKSVYKIIAVIIASLLIIGLVLPVVFANALTTKEINDAIAGANKAINDLERRIDSVMKEQKALKDKITSTSSQQLSIQEQKERLDKQMNLLREEIDIQIALVEEYSRQIAALTEQSAYLERQLEAKMQQYYARVRANFEEGTLSYWEVLLSSESFTDFLVRLDLVEAIISSDKQFIQSLERDKANIQAVKDATEESYVIQVRIKRDLEDRQSQLSLKIDESKALIAKLDNSLSSYENSYEYYLNMEEQLNKQLEEQLAKLAELTAYIGGKFEWPTPNVYKITSPFGPRVHPITKTNSFHYGVDIAASSGSKILAANSGTVITASYNSVNGYYVVIDHGGGITSLYAHMTKHTVKSGQTIEKGKQIGIVGSTGWATGPHLHFEIRENGVAVNPLTYYDF